MEGIRGLNSVQMYQIQLARADKMEWKKNHMLRSYR